MQNTETFKNEKNWMKNVLVIIDDILAQHKNWDVDALRTIYLEQLATMQTYENKEFRDDYRQSMISDDAIYLFSLVREVSDNERITTDNIDIKNALHVTDFYFISSKLEFQEDWRYVGGISPE